MESHSSVSSTKPNPLHNSVVNNWNKQEDKRQFKIICIGDASVGKTCLLKRYFEDTFDDNS